MQQRYVSSELTHFVGSNLTPNREKQFDTLVRILETGILSPIPNQPEIWHNYSVQWPLHIDKQGETSGIFRVCFCDIPLGDLNVHIRKYSEFGLAFPKSFLVERGASPVFYVAKNAIVPGSNSDGQLGSHFVEMLGRLGDLVDSADPSDANDINLFLVHQLLGYFKPFDSRNADDDKDNYYMEREWRIIGGVRFAISDVCRIIIPRSHAQRLRERLPAYYAQVSFVEE